MRTKFSTLSSICLISTLAISGCSTAESKSEPPKNEAHKTETPKKQPEVSQVEVKGATGKNGAPSNAELSAAGLVIKASDDKEGLKKSCDAVDAADKKLEEIGTRQSKLDKEVTAWLKANPNPDKHEALAKYSQIAKTYAEAADVYDSLSQLEYVIGKSEEYKAYAKDSREYAAIDLERAAHDPAVDEAAQKLHDKVIANDEQIYENIQNTLSVCKAKTNG